MLGTAIIYAVLSFRPTLPLPSTSAARLHSAACRTTAPHLSDLNRWDDEAHLPSEEPASGFSDDEEAAAWPAYEEETPWAEMSSRVGDAMARVGAGEPLLWDESLESTDLHADEQNTYEVPSPDLEAPSEDAQGAALRAPVPPAASAPSAPAPRKHPPNYGVETPMPGREQEYEAFMAQGGAQAAVDTFLPPPIDEDRRSRSPGLSRNFFDVPTADFKRPYGMGRGPAPPEPQAPPAAPEAPPPPAIEFGAESPLPGRDKQAAEGGFSYVPPPIDEERRSRSPGLRHNFYDVPMYDFRKPFGSATGPPPSAPEAPSVAPGMSSPPKSASEAIANQKGASEAKRPKGASEAKVPPGYGVETPMPGREKEYEAFMAQGGAQAAGDTFLPPPIDEDRRSRSPGLSRNFFDVPTADFKRPYGMGRGPAPPEPQTPPAAPDVSRAAAPPQAPPSMTPGRDKQVIASEEQAAGRGNAYAPPPIDAERRSRSPGLQHNFYDVPTSDFKRPYGSGGPAPAQPEAPSVPRARDATGEAKAPPKGASGAEVPPGYGVETPMPGREKEYEAFMSQGGAPPAGDTFLPPPIDEDRRSRSPGLSRNFFDVPTADFKRPYGMGRGPAPPEPQAPPETESTSAGPAAGGEDEAPPKPLSGQVSFNPIKPTGRTGDVLLSRLARLENSIEEMDAALLAVRAREQVAKQEAEEGRVREEMLAKQLAALAEEARRESAEGRAREESLSRQLAALVEEAKREAETARREAETARREAETARREAEEARARKDSLSQQLAALEARLEAVAPGAATGRPHAGSASEEEARKAWLASREAAARGEAASPQQPGTAALSPEEQAKRAWLAKQGSASWGDRRPPSEPQAAASAPPAALTAEEAAKRAWLARQSPPAWGGRPEPPAAAVAPQAQLSPEEEAKRAWLAKQEAPSRAPQPPPPQAEPSPPAHVSAQAPPQQQQAVQLSAEEEAKRAWLAKQGPPSWSRAAPQPPSPQSPSRQPEASLPRQTEEEARRAWLNMMDVPVKGNGASQPPPPVQMSERQATHWLGGQGAASHGIGEQHPSASLPIQMSDDSGKNSWFGNLDLPSWRKAR